MFADTAFLLGIRQYVTYSVLAYVGSDCKSQQKLKIPIVSKDACTRIRNANVAYTGAAIILIRELKKNYNIIIISLNKSMTRKK